MNENKKTSIIDAAVDIFSGLYKSDVAAQREILLNDAYIDEKIGKITTILRLDATDAEELVRRIKAIYAIYQPEGIAILDDMTILTTGMKSSTFQSNFFGIDTSVSC